MTTQPELPDIEVGSATVHDAWIEATREQGITSPKSEAGAELLVPYAQPSQE